MMKRILLATLCALLLISALPTQALAAQDIVVDVAKTESDKDWLRGYFPKLRSVKEEETHFVFASAPKCVKTRAVLNQKGESLTMYRFADERAMQKCVAMIQGSALVYGGKTVYADTKLPVTYFYNVKENVIALYCGADAAVYGKLLQDYTVAGIYGGYFSQRHAIVHDGMEIAIPRTGAAESLKEVKVMADSVYVVTVKKASIWKDGNVKGRHELEVTKNVRGIARKSFRISGEWPEILRPGRSYVVCIVHQATVQGGTVVRLADREHKSVFEIDDRGYALPVREYGMKASVKLETLLKQL